MDENGGLPQFTARVGKLSRPLTERDLYILEDGQFEDADFSRRKASIGFRLLRCTFVRCDFSGVRVPEFCFGAGPVQSLYRECVFDGARFGARAPGNARFERCSFRDVRIEYLMAYGLEFVDCVFSGRLSEVNFWGSVRDEEFRGSYGRAHNDFTGNDFVGADLVMCAFLGGIDLTTNNMPVGPRAMVVLDGREAFARVGARLEGLDDRTLAEAAARTLTVHRRELDGGQTGLWMRRDDCDAKYARQYELLFDFFAQESQSRLGGP